MKKSKKIAVCQLIFDVHKIFMMYTSLSGQKYSCCFSMSYGRIPWLKSKVKFMTCFRQPDVWTQANFPSKASRILTKLQYILGCILKSQNDLKSICMVNCLSASQSLLEITLVCNLVWFKSRFFFQRSDHFLHLIFFIISLRAVNYSMTMLGLIVNLP